MYVMNGTHGLASDERRFLFDPINEDFHPIYYDGDFGIFDKNKNFIPKFNYKDLNNQISKVSFSFIDGANEALKKIEKLNVKIFYNKLKKYGSKLTLTDVEEAIDIINFRLKELQSLSHEYIDRVNLREDLNYFNNLNFKSDIKRKIIFYKNLEMNLLSVIYMEKIVKK